MQSGYCPCSNEARHPDVGQLIVENKGISNKISREDEKILFSLPTPSQLVSATRVPVEPT